MSENIIKEVVKRTKGEMYLGVVGPVRSGKSTFIRKFMEIKVLPFIKDEITYQKVLDELPLSSDGKTILTVEPKFIPSNTMTINIDNDLNISIRLVDCVGYVMENAKGYLNDDGSLKLVQTPWYSEPIPFGDAAGLGTRKVIEAHSNIGVLMSSDGSFGEFSRLEYEKIEETMVSELKNLNKPFVLVINTTHPNDLKTITLIEKLKEKYDVSVMALDVLKMDSHNIDELLKEALNEFDICELNIDIPNWITAIDNDIPFKQHFNELIDTTTINYRKMKDAFKIQNTLKESNMFNNVEITDIDAGNGIVNILLSFDEGIYNQILEEILGEDLSDRKAFIEAIQKLKKAELIYDKVGNLNKVFENGYDIVIPPIKDMKLDQPELAKQGSRYGIKLKAHASCLLVTKIEVESSFEPIIGGMDQSQILVDHMIEDYQANQDIIWQSEFFGRKLSEVINDGIKVKVKNVPDKVLAKYKEGMEKVVNHNKGGILAIIL